jgi:hypothetical protein
MVWLGGRRVPLVKAALMGQEADRRHLTPSRVVRVEVPDPAPTHVKIAGKRLTVRAAALIAAEADARGVEPAKVIAASLEEQVPQMEDAKSKEKGARG